MSKQTTYPTPPLWTLDQIEEDVELSIRLFRQERLEEPAESYLEAFDEIQETIETILESTTDLSQLHENALQILSDSNMLTGFRYLAGPPISRDDLLTIVDTNSLAPSTLKRNPELLNLVVSTIQIGLDRRRFPWVAEGREPTEKEKYAAIIASTALIATQRVATKRRTAGKTSQEELVRQSLVDIGFTEVKVVGNSIQTIIDAPQSGTFCREVLLGNQKADLVVGLWGNRIVPIECKVSNSSVNSIKRLNREAVGKGKDWLTEFGRRNVFPVAVLGGVFKSSNVFLAQESGLTIIWAHRLRDLINWIEIIRELYSER